MPRILTSPVKQLKTCNYHHLRAAKLESAEMKSAFREALHTARHSRLQASSATRLPKAISRLQRVSTRLSSTATKPIEDVPSASKEKLLSISPLPNLPPRPKGTPPTVTTRDIERYVQPLYVRGWGLAPILPNGNGIAVLRKRFDFTSAEAMETFLTKLKEYEAKKKVCLRIHERPKKKLQTDLFHDLFLKKKKAPCADKGV
jgi:hypothetical protein